MNKTPMVATGSTLNVVSKIMYRLCGKKRLT